MKKQLITTLMTIVATLTPVMGNEGNFSINGLASLTTNYVTRGISYSNETPTAQAGLNFENIANVEGIHLNLWGSGMQEGSEIDVIVGFDNAIGAFMYDVGAMYYYYTQESMAETFAGPSYFEGYVTLGYEAFFVSLYREVGFGDASTLDGTTAIAGVSWEFIDLQGGVRLSPTTTRSYFGTLATNWSCLLDESYAMSASVNYNSAYLEQQALLGLSGATFALSITKTF